MLFAASYYGIPVSTTHTINGCVIGAGAARRASAVRWGVARNVMIAWLITIPASATVAALFYLLASGEIALTLAGLDLIALIGLGIFAWRETKLQSGSPTRIWAMLAVLGIATAAVIVIYGLAE